MDSDDERDLEQENQRLEKGREWQTPLVYVKLFQEEEEEAKKEAYEECLDRRQRYGVAVDWLSQCPSVWRVRRFLDTIRGFHEGRLDMRGRSRSRYLSYRRKLAAFLQDIHELRRHVAMAERSAELPLTSLHPSQQMFQAKYKTQGIIYEELFEAADKAEAYFESPGSPRFQQLFLLDLPPEVIQLIVRFCYSNESYQAAATCQVLHRVFWDVANKSLKLFNNFSDRSQSYRNQVYGMQRRFLDDSDVILMHMLLSRGLRELVIRDSWDRSSGLFTAEGVTVAEQRELRKELLSRIELVLARARATNLVILGLHGVTLSRAMLNIIAAMPRLRVLRIIQCEFPTRSPDTDSTNKEHVEYPSIASFVLSPHPSFDSVDAFELLHQLPNVRAITFTGPMTRGSLETANLARLNVLRTTERLTITCWTDDDLTRVHRWLRAACNDLNGALRLTHLKIGDGDELGHGIPLDVMHDLFIALRGTPLQTLALQGVAGVRPGLFTTIAAAFPSLTALTMIYRRATSRFVEPYDEPVGWALLMSEYAACFAAFKHLRYLALNIPVGALKVGTTFDLPWVEENYPSGCTASVCTEDLWITDWQCIARLFLAYCPTLNTLVFVTSLGIPRLRFEMWRDAAGEAHVLQCKHSVLSGGTQSEDFNPINAGVPSDNQWILYRPAAS